MRQNRIACVQRGYLSYTFVLAVCVYLFVCVHILVCVYLFVCVCYCRIRFLTIVACVIIDHDRIRFGNSNLNDGFMKKKKRSIAIFASARSCKSKLVKSRCLVEPVWMELIKNRDLQLLGSLLGNNCSELFLPSVGN